MKIMNIPLVYFERIAVGILLFSATGVTVFTRSSMTWEYFPMPVMLGAMALILSIFYRITLSRRFIFLILTYIILFLFQCIIYNSVHWKQLLLYPFNFWVAYCFVRAMRERFLLHLEFLITRLAGISLVIWGLDVITGHAVRNLLSGKSVGEPYNVIIDSYIIIQTFIKEGVESILPRNSGFAWEPGAFAVLCCAALMINIYRTQTVRGWNIGAGVLIAALISTLSTTGYGILMAFFLVKMWRDIRGTTKFFLLPVLVLALALSVYYLPFMQNKIIALWSEDLGELAANASRAWHADQPVAAQRFLSLQLDFSDFLNNPWTGYGGEENEMLINREGLNIVSVSGIGKIMARFGILGIGFFVWSTWLSSVYLSRQFRAESPALLALYIMLVSISYSLIEHPLFLSIWSYWFFSRAGVDRPGTFKGRVAS